MLCRVIVPMEYGMTTNQKVEVGLKVITPLLKKIHHDLLWWMSPNTNGLKSSSFESENREWDKQGLNEEKAGDLVKSSWRHIRTRLYFTSASHMYTLLNALKLGADRTLFEPGDTEAQAKLDRILRMDFLSSFVFRLFENLSTEENDKSRFKLEIMVNRGAVTNPSDIVDVTDHTIPIKEELFVDINKKLNLH